MPYFTHRRLNMRPNGCMKSAVNTTFTVMAMDRVEETDGNAPATAAATVRAATVELYAGTDSLLVWQTKKWEVTKDGTLADKARGKFVDIGGTEGIMSTWALLDYLRTGKWYARIGDDWVKISKMVTD